MILRCPELAGQPALIIGLGQFQVLACVSGAWQCGGIVGVVAEEHEVVRATGLRAEPDGGLLPAAEGLTPHDRAGDAAVDVGVADLDFVEPGAHLFGIEGVDAAGETEVHRVLELDGFVEVTGVHESEHGSEHLGEVEEGPRLDAVLDSRTPQATRVIELLRLEQPGLTGFEGGQGPFELVGGILGQRSHGCRHVRRPVDDHRRGGIDELAPVALRIIG